MSTETIDRGNWMQTFTGRQFYPLAPYPEDVDPRDIAHALSLICRYGGHAERFYSVAEHCVLMSYAVAPENALWALLHDATEAYVGDMVRPLKQHMPQYQMAETKVELAILQRFGLWGGAGLPPLMPAEVKAADSRILLDERAALFDGIPAPWAIEHLTPLGVFVEGWSPVDAERCYADRLAALLDPTAPEAEHEHYSVREAQECPSCEPIVVSPGAFIETAVPEVEDRARADEREPGVVDLLGKLQEAVDRAREDRIARPEADTTGGEGS